MSSVKNINLTEKGQYLLFRAVVCEVLTKEGFKGDAWAFSDLDMSFEEVQDQPINTWAKAIRKDMADYKRDCPEDFSEIALIAKHTRRRVGILLSHQRNEESP